MKERKEMIQVGASEMSIRHQSALLSVNRSGLYYVPCDETEENLRIMHYLDVQYLKTPFYGERRLLAGLRKESFRINKKRLRRLMKAVLWRTIYPKKRTTVPDGQRFSEKKVIS